MAKQKAQVWYKQLNVHIRSFQLAHIPDYEQKHRKEVIAEHRAIRSALEQHDEAVAREAVRHYALAARTMFIAQAVSLGLLRSDEVDGRVPRVA